MNYSYLMGINNIDILKQNNVEIKYFGNNYGVIFDDNKIELFEKYICETLENGFWNEYLGKDKVFIFKFKNSKIKYLANNVSTPFARHHSVSALEKRFFCSPIVYYYKCIIAYLHFKVKSLHRHPHVPYTHFLPAPHQYPRTHN